MFGDAAPLYGGQLSPTAPKLSNGKPIFVFMARIAIFFLGETNRTMEVLIRQKETLVNTVDYV